MLGLVIAAAVLVFVLSRPPSEVRETSDSPPAAAPQARPQPEAVPLQAAIAEFAQPQVRTDLTKIYTESQFRPLWTADRAGRKRLQAVDAFSQSLAAQGLDPAFLNTAKEGLLAADTKEARLRAEVTMSAAVLRAAYGQRLGFLSAENLGWNIAPDKVEVASFLGEAAARNSLAGFFDSLKPRHAQFAALSEALARYRQIAASGGWGALPADTEINLAGDARLPALRARLAAEGYLSADAGDAALAEAVKQYQTRNGQEPDGRVGRGTLAALNVPVERRIEQITANLERWRHMRHQEPNAYVATNAADQTVALVRGGREELKLRTVVGSPRHATPILEAILTGVTLNPPWEIPTSIITNEILPKLDEEPYYLMDQGMDVVSGDWDNPKSLRIRQRPGVGNSLGHMKFQMQNEWNIYLHDTPSRALFEKPERLFSHGCIRVQNPEQLAAALTGSSVEELNEGIASGETRTVSLDTPLPVFVLYWTVFADPDGHINFRRDAYDRDAQTVAALAGAGLSKSSEVVTTSN